MSTDLLVPSGKPPLHIALLPDGARRWAVKKGCSVETSYSYSAVRLANTVQELLGPHCNEITVLLSNWRNHLRSSADLVAFEDGIREFIAIAKEKCEREWRCSIHFLCPKELRDDFCILSTVQFPNNPRRLNICVAYDPLTELWDSIQKSGSSRGDIFENLKINRPVDLAIRTGGSPLFSGFIPLQLAYARLYLVEELFNDVDSSQFAAAVGEFCNLPLVYGT
ncbi:undecaprenyl diphosphate synthase family protein [Maricaulis maris]|uniref:undecaprenyl diphosphate synthase family protein n=1 Tax=Maricaulis maris TaxID=74318 RepID=UPI003A8CA9AB